MKAAYVRGVFARDNAGDVSAACSGLATEHLAAAKEAANTATKTEELKAEMDAKHK